jgi:hypothetical protein
MMTGAMDAATTTTAIPMRTAIRSAVGTVLITQVSRPAWPSAIVFPGLERQLVVRGTLPPGLQKKMQPCPPDLERMLPPPPPNYAHVVIGGNLVLLNRANFEIADVFHLEIR